MKPGVSRFHVAEVDMRKFMDLYINWKSSSHFNTAIKELDQKQYEVIIQEDGEIMEDVGRAVVGWAGCFCWKNTITPEEAGAVVLLFGFSRLSRSSGLVLSSSLEPSIIASASRTGHSPLPSWHPPRAPATLPFHHGIRLAHRPLSTSITSDVNATLSVDEVPLRHRKTSIVTTPTPPHMHLKDRHIVETSLSVHTCI